MVIVAVLISLLASFSPLAKLIMPVDLTFMIANVGLTCDAADKSFTPSATGLLTFIYSLDEKYIKKIDDYLQGKSEDYIDETAAFLRKKVGPLLGLSDEQTVYSDLTFIKKNNTDENYNLLNKFAANTRNLGSSGLSEELSDNSKWIAYTIKVNAPSIKTSIPIPTIYDFHHTTRLFVVLNDPPLGPDPALASLNSAIGLTSQSQKLSPREKSLSSLIKTEIAPKLPHGKSGETDLAVQVFYNDTKHICWNTGG